MVKFTLFSGEDVVIKPIKKGRVGATVRINEEIRVREVRLIGVDKESLGVVLIQQALAAAEEAGLDLVEISPNADPPVCQIMDYGKFAFQQSKKAAEAKKKQKRIQVKEIKFRPTTEKGDYDVKLRKLVEFLDKGDKVKVTMRFRGRELAHVDIGLNMLDKLERDLKSYGTLEQSAKREGRQVVMVFSPAKKS